MATSKYLNHTQLRNETESLSLLNSRLKKGGGLFSTKNSKILERLVEEESSYFSRRRNRRREPAAHVGEEEGSGEGPGERERSALGPRRADNRDRDPQQNKAAVDFDVRPPHAATSRRTSSAGRSRTPGRTRRRPATLLSSILVSAVCDRPNFIPRFTPTAAASPGCMSAAGTAFLAAGFFGA